ncbi:bleomycin hydrolase [Mariniphaga anaerophila]|uniref:Aminopeptidase n=1 Tax=Mariniphaga anaerophila TaxID=1484053 RepID=A0A1M5A0S9_9BACT|nr:C1 family peptidase [Mariniphaga anaerophila]SHF23868.1 bleomycin hydrolase [Mariniphaga anaerophila]
MRISSINILAAFFVVSFSLPAIAGDEVKKEKKEAWKFEDVISLPATPVEDQHRSGTCWSFSGLSFLESEMIRLGKPEVNLSEMYTVWHTYAEKATKHVRLHGNLNFSAGGAFHDVTNMIAKYGAVPESVYDGLKYGEDKHVHGEMDRVLREYVDAVIENKNRKLSTAWHDAFTQILDTYLGELPQKFEYEGKSYTPMSFADNYMGLNMDDYVEITSYTHHPFYSKFILEIPDNWSWDEMYNVPLDEFEEIIDYSLNNGFTIAWAADVSEKGFVSGNKGVAVLPAAPQTDMSDAEISRWEALPERERENELYKLDKPVPELKVDQEMRQIAFDNFQTTDDHGMHIIGTAVDRDGNTFYKVKNSWGEYNKFDGYFYASKPYVKYKTMCIMVHKDAIPPGIREKLNL